MLSKICYKIAYFFVEKKVISEKDAEIYQYGFEQIISGIYTMLSILIISILFNNVVEGIIFLLCFIPLRRFAGGYHADTYLKCYIYFMVIYMSIMILINTSIINYNLYISFSVLILSFVGLNLFSPVENENRPIESKEKNKSKNIVFFISIIETVLLIVMYLYNLSFYKIIYFSLIWTSILQIIQLLKNKIQHFEVEIL